MELLLILKFGVLFSSYLTILVKIYYNTFIIVFNLFISQWPYHAEYTSSRPITEVKQRRAQSVLGWVTAWEH